MKGAMARPNCDFLRLALESWGNALSSQTWLRQLRLVALAGAGALFMIETTKRCKKELNSRRMAAAPECDLLSVAVGRLSLLHWVAHHGHTTLLRAILASARPGAQNEAMLGTQWTPLHFAATRGHTTAVDVLLACNADPEAADARGHTALAIAIARGYPAIARLLLEARASPNSVDSKKKSALHFAALRGDECLTALLLDFGANRDTSDSEGRTPLLDAALKSERWPAASVLLERGANATAATYGEGLSALMLVARWGGPADMYSAAATKKLLQHAADPAIVDRFGQTALHISCRDGMVENIKALCIGGAPVAAQDNDGLYPLQALCSRCAHLPNDTQLVEMGLQAIIQADPEGVRRLDFGDATALHTLCMLAAVERTKPLSALRCLIVAQADPSVVEDGGWNVVHFAANHPDETAREAMLELLQESVVTAKDFWDRLDFKKVRDLSNRKYLQRRGGAHRIPLDERHDVLRGDISLQGVAARIADARSQRVVVLLGAGASTGAGIPDYRSPSGMWTKSGSRMFGSMAGFAAEPEVFWNKYAELFEGRRPTLVHRLLARLASDGRLLRVYTQNIDGLETAAGVPEDLVVHCHGTALKCICSADKFHPVQLSSAQIWAQQAEAGESWCAPMCTTCGALVRPDVVFFGEPLPTCFTRHSAEDFHQCDLLIVVGSTLSVYPVAGLVNIVGMLTPRLLINREVVGAWRNSWGAEENYRDVFFEGDCEDGAGQLADALGWKLGK